MSTPPNSTQAEAPAREPESALTNTIRLLARLGRERFFGKLTIEYKNGDIIVIRREETIKP